MTVRGAALRRWAARGPVPVFVARGGGVGLLPVELSGDPSLRVVASPRHATVLVAAGRFPGALGAALDRLHDQLGRPRRTVWWTADPDAERPAALWDATVATGADPVAAIHHVHGEAMTAGGGGGDVFPDVPPNLFEGRGDHGQGGEAMMGGVPYGRPMAMTGDDRDGLPLDQWELTLGPFLPGLPNGLTVAATLQGGLVQRAESQVLDLGEGPSLDAAADPAVAHDPEHELRHDLRWLAEVLRLGGLDALSVRAARAARSVTAAPATGTSHQPGRPDQVVQQVSRLAGLVRRSGLASAWSGVGVVDGIDAGDRLAARLARLTEPDERTDGEADHRVIDRLSALLVGQDWADALVTVASLDVDTEAVRSCPQVIR